MRFAEKLKSLMEVHRLAERDVAERANVSPATAHRWTKSTWPRLDEALRLARSLGVSLEYLADDSLDEPPVSAFTDDERLVLRVVHALGLSADEVVRQLNLAASLSGSVPAPSKATLPSKPEVFRRPPDGDSGSGRGRKSS